MLIDLSHPIRAGLTTYPGLPEPVITPHLTREASRGVYAPGTEFAMDVITMIGNTGTYLDSPFHRYADGGDLASLELETLVGLPTAVVRLAEGSRSIDADAFAGLDVAGHAVLLDTGWSSRFGTPAYRDHAPFLTGAGAAALVDAGAALVGIDSLNIDDTESGGERQGMGSTGRIYFGRIRLAKSYNFGHGALMRVNESIKNALDPNGVLVPGKAGMWSRR